MLGGNGNDRLSGTTGDDYIDGGYGNDTITGNKGTDNLRGSNGRDSINAQDGDDDIVDGGTGFRHRQHGYQRFFLQGRIPQLPNALAFSFHFEKPQHQRLDLAAKLRVGAKPAHEARRAIEWTVQRVAAAPSVRMTPASSAISRVAQS